MGVLRGLTAGLNQSINAVLGDEITYTPNGGSPRTFHCWVDFGSEHFSGPGSSATKRNTITVEIPYAELDADPQTNVDRVAITIRPGLLFTPADVRDGEDGESWVIPLKQVAA